MAHGTTGEDRRGNVRDQAFHGTAGEGGIVLALDGAPMMEQIRPCLQKNFVLIGRCDDKCVTEIDERFAMVAFDIVASDPADFEFGRKPMNGLNGMEAIKDERDIELRMEAKFGAAAFDPGRTIAGDDNSAQSGAIVGRREIVGDLTP